MTTTSAEGANLNQQITEQMQASHGFRQTLANALIVTRREVRDSFRDWRIIVPIFLLTLVFPFLANLASVLFVGLFETYGEAETENLIDSFLPLMPMLVGFFPISISLVIALETFVGEKERLSLEPLLSTPLTNTELYIGKVLSAILPPLAAGYFGIVLYVSVQILGAQQWRPDPMLIVQIMLLTAVQAVTMVTGAVVISSQTTSTRAANLLASFVIIPMSLLIIVESLIMIQPDSRYVLWWIMLGLIVLIVLLLRTGTRIFNREELLGRAIDQINLRWAWRIFTDQWNGGVDTFNPLRWYRKSVFPSIAGLGRPMLVYAACAVLFFIGGWTQTTVFELPLGETGVTEEEQLENLRDVFELGQSNPAFMAFVVAQNTRVLMLATFLAIFTLGVMGLVLTALPFGLLGFVFGSIVASGVDPTPFILAVIPHGVVEIPAILIAGAAALRLGAVVTRPPAEMSAGEAWVRALSDAFKLGIFVVFPMLIVSAILEVQLTPTIVEWVLSN